MKLTMKLVFILVLGIILLQLIEGYLSIRREIKFFDSEMEHKAMLVGHAMKDLLTDVLQNSGYPRAMQLVRDANRGNRLINIRWVWLDISPETPNGPRLSLRKLERVAHGIEMSFRGKDREGMGYRYTYIPVLTSGNRQGAIEISEPLTHLNQYAWGSAVRGIFFIFVLIAVSCFLALLASLIMVGRPLDRIMEKVRRVGTGDLSGPLQLQGRYEFTELAQSLNSMCNRLAESKEKIYEETTARIDALEQLRHADRLSTVGSLASGVAHELGTPLNVVSARAGLIASKTLTEEESVENANIIKAQTERMILIIRQLLDFARRRNPKKAPVDLRTIVTQTIDLLAALVKKQKVLLKFSRENDPVIIIVDAAQIQQVLTNLIINAIQAMPQGGVLEVVIRRIEQTDVLKHPNGVYVCIDVIDEGEGIPEENMNHLFDPFFTTKNVGEGTGLGLSIVHGIIQDHGGWVDVQTELGEGTCFSVYLPYEVDE